MFCAKMIKTLGYDYMFVFMIYSKSGTNNIQVTYYSQSFCFTEEDRNKIIRALNTSCFSHILTEETRSRLDITAKYHVLITEKNREDLTKAITDTFEGEYAYMVRNIFSRLSRAFEVYQFNKNMLDII